MVRPRIPKTRKTQMKIKDIYKKQSLPIVIERINNSLEIDNGFLITNCIEIEFQILYSHVAYLKPFSIMEIQDYYTEKVYMHIFNTFYIEIKDILCSAPDYSFTDDSNGPSVECHIKIVGDLIEKENFEINEMNAMPVTGRILDLD